MGIEIKLTWEPEPWIRGRLQPALADGINAAAQVLQTEMKRNFVVRGSPGFGTKVPPELGRKGRGPGSYVSAPLANPSYQTGNTSRSIRVLQYASSQRLSASVGTKNPVGAYLENGTLPRVSAARLIAGAGSARQAVHSGMAPRPWLSNAVYFGRAKMRSALFDVARSSMSGVRYLKHA